MAVTMAAPCLGGLLYMGRMTCMLTRHQVPTCKFQHIPCMQVTASQGVIAHTCRSQQGFRASSQICQATNSFTDANSVFWMERMTCVPGHEGSHSTRQDCSHQQKGLIDRRVKGNTLQHNNAQMLSSQSLGSARVGWFMSATLSPLSAGCRPSWLCLDQT